MFLYMYTYICKLYIPHLTNTILPFSLSLSLSLYPSIFLFFVSFFSLIFSSLSSLHAEEGSKWRKEGRKESILKTLVIRLQITSHDITRIDANTIRRILPAWLISIVRANWHDCSLSFSLSFFLSFSSSFYFLTRWPLLIKLIHREQREWSSVILEQAWPIHGHLERKIQSDFFCFRDSLYNFHLYKYKYK